jgi:hypothetical protein
LCAAVADLLACYLSDFHWNDLPEVEADAQDE